MNKLLNDEVFDVLLYVSRLEADGNVREVLKNQISSIVSYFDELEKFKDEYLDENKFDNALQYNTENDLRLTSVDHNFDSSSSTSCIEQKMLKAMNEEFMDGYFRTPKVLGSS